VLEDKFGIHRSPPIEESIENGEDLKGGEGKYGVVGNRRFCGVFEQVEEEEGLCLFISDGSNRQLEAILKFKGRKFF